MAFEQDNFAPISAHASPSPSVYSYVTSDSVATVNTSGYFDAKKFQLNVGDVIILLISDVLNFIEVTQSDTTVETRSFISRDSNGHYGIGTDAPVCELHILSSTGLVCARLESTDPTTGIMQLQLMNDDSKELSIGKLGSSVNFFGTGSGAILNREGNLNIISDSNDPIIFYTDETDAQDLSATEKARIEPGGTLVFTNGGETWKDINLGAARLSTPAVNNPDSVEFKDNTGTDTGIVTYAFAPGERVSGEFEIQHDYKEGTDLYFHVHFQGITAPTGTDKVQWQLTYTIAKNTETLDPVTVLTNECDYDTQYAFELCSFSAIDGTDVTIGDQFLFQIQRIAASADEYAGDALLATVGVHYQNDTLGSRSIATK